jgi:hypothetical protein
MLRIAEQLAAHRSVGTQIRFVQNQLFGWPDPLTTVPLAGSSAHLLLVSMHLLGPERQAAADGTLHDALGAVVMQVGGVCIGHHSFAALITMDCSIFAVVQFVILSLVVGHNRSAELPTI